MPSQFWCGPQLNLSMIVEKRKNGGQMLLVFLCCWICHSFCNGSLPFCRPTIRQPKCCCCCCHVVCGALMAPLHAVIISGSVIFYVGSCAKSPVRFRTYVCMYVSTVPILTLCPPYFLLFLPIFSCSPYNIFFFIFLTISILMFSYYEFSY